MSNSMRKIIYYENVLELKKNTKEHLNLNEINNWRLCRTCLVDTCEDDLNMEKMKVMDIMQGTFLNIKEMLVESTNIEISTNENLPLQLCKECINKITTLYYFCIQVRKADKVLKRLANKLKGCHEVLQEACETENNFTDIDEIPDDSMILQAEEVSDYPQDLENWDDIENSATDENRILKEEFEKTVVKTSSEYLEKMSNIESVLITDKKTTLLPDRKEARLKIDEVALLENEEDYIDLKNDSIDEESHLGNDLFEALDTSDYDNEESTIITTTITTEKVQNATRRPRKRATNVKQMTGYRHKQPRVTSPLLNDFDCVICQESFGRQQDLIHHVRNSHPNSKAYECRACGKLFSHIQSLSRHMNTHKASVILNECNYCSKSFVRADDLKRHVRIHTGERPHVCSICEKSYQQHCELKRHEEKHLNLQTKKFECAQCKQCYISRTGLYLHKRKYHRQGGNGNEVPYDCTLCEKSFHLPSELKRHVGYHFRPESIKCTECDQKFASHNGLYIHKKIHHETESQAEQECEKENEVFIKIAEEDIEY